MSSNQYHQIHHEISFHNLLYLVSRLLLLLFHYKIGQTKVSLTQSNSRSHFIFGTKGVLWNELLPHNAKVTSGYLSINKILWNLKAALKIKIFLLSLGGGVIFMKKIEQLNTNDKDTNFIAFVTKIRQTTILQMLFCPCGWLTTQVALGLYKPCSVPQMFEGLLVGIPKK